MTSRAILTVYVRETAPTNLAIRRSRLNGRSLLPGFLTRLLGGLGGLLRRAEAQRLLVGRDARRGVARDLLQLAHLLDQREPGVLVSDEVGVREDVDRQGAKVRHGDLVIPQVDDLILAKAQRLHLDSDRRCSLIEHQRHVRFSLVLPRPWIRHEVGNNGTINNSFCQRPLCHKKHNY